MVSDETAAKAIGPWALGVGAVMFVTGLAWLVWPNLAEWQYVSIALMACSAPVLVAYTAYLVVYVAREWPKPPPPAAPAKVAPPAPEPDYDNDWRAAAHHFVQWGAHYGFNIRDLALRGEPGKCISWDDWRRMVDYLLEPDVLAGAGQDTRFADNWDLARWEKERRSLALPHRDFAPPAVSIYVRHHNNSAHNSDDGGAGE